MVAGMFGREADEAANAAVTAMPVKSNPLDNIHGPSEPIPMLNAFTDLAADGYAILRPAGRQTARQRLRSTRASNALRAAHASYLHRMDDYYPDDGDYRSAADAFIDLTARAIAGDAEAQATLAGYLGIDTAAVFALIDALRGDAAHDLDALRAAIRAVLALADHHEPTDDREPRPVDDLHLQDVNRAVAPLHGPTSHAMTRTHHRRVMAAA